MKTAARHAFGDALPLTALAAVFLVAACDEPPTQPEPDAAASSRAAGHELLVGTPEVGSSDLRMTVPYVPGETVALAPADHAAGVQPPRVELPEPVTAGRAGSGFSASPSGGAQGDAPADFPLVLVRSGPGADTSTGTGAPVVDNLADALERVAGGGTVRVFPGTYVTEDVLVDKPVTIESGAGERPVLVNVGGTASLQVSGLASGEVLIRGLDFRNESPAIVEGSTALIVTAGVLATGEYDVVRIEDSRFQMAHSALTGVLSLVPSNPASAVTVTGSTFRGGFLGTFATGSPSFEVRDGDYASHRILAASFNNSVGGVSGSVLGDCGSSTCVTGFNGADVVHERNELHNCAPRTCMNVSGEGTRGLIRDNRFRDDQTDVDPFFHHTVLVRQGARATISGNVFDGCGKGRCVLAVSRAEAKVTGNEMNLHASHGTLVAIGGSDGTGGGAPNPAQAPTLLVSDNVIRGIGGTQDPTDPESFGIRFEAVAVEASARASLVRNQISNAGAGVGAFRGGAILDSRDNTVENVHTGVRIFDGGSVALDASDFTDYAVSIDESGNADPGDLTCNWWGSPAGPRSPQVSDPALYTPWATSPVAGTSTTTCSGGL